MSMLGEDEDADEPTLVPPTGAVGFTSNEAAAVRPVTLLPGEAVVDSATPVVASLVGSPTVQLGTLFVTRQARRAAAARLAGRLAGWLSSAQLPHVLHARRFQDGAGVADRARVVVRWWVTHCSRTDGRRRALHWG
jgi:hypothetical protein